MDDKQALALSKDLAGDLPSGHERDIAKTFLTSIESLPTEAQDLLTLATLLSNAPISSDLIAGCKRARQGAASQGAGAADEQAERKALMGAEDWAARCMKQLTDCSLADPSAEEPAAPGARAVPAITVHTLIARVARWRLADGTANTQANQASQATVQWRQAAVLTLQHAMRAAADIGQHAALLHEVQHARQLCEKVETLDQAMLLERIAEYDDARGHYALAHAAWQTVLKHRERVLVPEHPATLTSMNNLALTLRDMGELPAARAMQEQVLAIGQRVLALEHRNTLTSMNNLADSLRAMGELPAARAMQEQVLDLMQRVLGSEHPDTISALGNLLIMLFDAKDDAGMKATATRHPATLAKFLAE